MKVVSIACLLLGLGCASSRGAANEQTTVAKADAAEAADGRRVPTGAREGTADEYQAEVMARAKRRGVQVIWVNGPRDGNGYILDRRPPGSIGFLQR